MKMKLTAGVVLLPLLFSACKSNDNQAKDEYIKKNSDHVVKEAIVHGYEDKDTGVINAYLNDKSTITINDIDPKDTSFKTRIKLLYKSNSDANGLAVVYGFKDNGNPGIAVMQKIGEKPITLKEGKMENGARIYSNGDITLQMTGNFAFLNGVQYEEIK